MAQRRAIKAKGEKPEFIWFLRWVDKILAIKTYPNVARSCFLGALPSSLGGPSQRAIFLWIGKSVSINFAWEFQYRH